VARFVRLLSWFVCVWVAALPARGAQKPLEVHFLDVGQGDSMLIRSPSGKNVLLDAGNTEAAPEIDRYLARTGVGTLDLAILSHPHLDHVGGMLDVLKKHRPAVFLDGAYPHALDNYADLLQWLEDEKIPVKLARTGRTITLEEGVTLEVLAPDDHFFEGTRSDANSNSVVLRLSYGTTSFLLTGDSEDETEQRLMEHDAAANPSRLAATVLKVAHHGGRYSTSDAWLDRVSPRFAVISCGLINPYGHPTRSTLGRLENHHAQVYRTDRDGDVVASSDGGKITWRTTGAASAKLDEPGGRRSYNRGDRTAAAEMAPAPDRVPEKPAAATPAATTDAAPRPSARPDLAFRPVAGRAATPPGDTSGRQAGGRMLAALGAVRANLNLSSAADIAKSCGVGTDVARAVVEARARGGLFRSAADLDRVEGLSPETRTSLLERGTLRLDLNSATEAQLVALGLTSEEADAVVARRHAAGPYSSVEDLENVPGLDPESGRKLRPFVLIDRLGPRR